MDIVDFTVLVLPGAQSASVATTLDLLSAAARLAVGSAAPCPRWRVRSPAGGTVQLQGGMHLAATLCLPQRRIDRTSLWIVPGLGVARPDALAARLAEQDALRAAAALRSHVAHGGAVAASCSAVFLLAQAGLLDGRRATTAWWLAPALQRRAPAARIDADHMVLSDGGLHTAGAAHAQADLMLHLLRLRCGPALADRVARMLLLDARSAQAPFVVPALLAAGDALLDRLTTRLENALPHPPRMAALALEFGMSARTLVRQVRAATGHGPLVLLQRVRLQRARQLLAQSRMGVEEVAAAVGFQDATALRRLSRRMLGAPPSRLRPPVPR